jgi:CheY-like chemotaxis protein
MPHRDPRPFEVLILGDLVVRENNADIPTLSATLAETLTLLAAYGRPTLARELRSVHSSGPSQDAFDHHITRLRQCGLPVLSAGPRGRTQYQLDPERCHVDAVAFVRGVDAVGDLDDLLRLWRGAAPASVLRPPVVKAAMTRLIKRISDLPDEDLAVLAEMPRFAALFPDEHDLDRARQSGPRSKPRLLVVEDNAPVMEEICGRLEATCRLTRLTSIEDWRRFRGSMAELRLIQGALIDLSLTALGDDQKGLEIVRYLQENTEIPVALVTANRMESSEYRQAERMEEFRLVDIVSKQSANWYNALEATADLLVGNGVVARRRRMETWLNAAHRKIRRETRDAAPGSVAARRRQQCDTDYAAALGVVRVGDVDAGQQAVDQFCVTWRVSG